MENHMITKNMKKNTKKDSHLTANINKKKKRWKKLL